MGWGRPEATSAFAPNALPNSARTPVFLRWNVRTRTLESQTTVAVRPSKTTLSPDGKKVAFLSEQPPNGRRGQYWIEVRNVASISIPGVLWPTNGVIGNLSWTPDSRQVILCDKKMRVYEAATGNLQRTIEMRRWLSDGVCFQSLTFSPDGNRAALLERTDYLKGTPKPYGGTNDDGGIIKGRLLIVSWPGLKLQAKLPGDIWENCVWTKDGKQLAALTNVTSNFTNLQTKIARYDLATRRTSRAVLQRPEKIYYSDPLTFSPGGNYLVAAKSFKEGSWMVWDAQNGQLLGTIGTSKIFGNGSYPSPSVAQFSGDGRYLLRPTPAGVEMWELERLRIR